jgi:hypothetical protein
MPKASDDLAKVSALKLVIGATALLLLMVPTASSARGTDAEQWPLSQLVNLKSMNAQPLRDDARAYRLIWHAWHKKPGMLTLTCKAGACTAELRHTDGFGTYHQGKLEKVYTKRVQELKALQVMSALDEGGVWALPPQLADEKGYRIGLPEGGQDWICLHAPYYFVEAKKLGRSLLAYRYCQPNYRDGLDAMAPLITLFEELFPTRISAVRPDPPKAPENAKTGDQK